MLYRLIIPYLFAMIIGSGQHSSYTKEYHREYYPTGEIKAEGWIMGEKKINFWIYYHQNGNIAQKGHFLNNQKNGYWFFYSTNNILKKEGHYINDKAEKWWVIYDSTLDLTKKCQYKNNKRDGFCLLYKKNKLFKAERYMSDLKTGEWTDLLSFKKDNPNISL